MKFWVSLILNLVVVLGFAQGPITGFMNKKNTTVLAITYAFDYYNEYAFGEELRPIETNLRI